MSSAKWCPFCLGLNEFTMQDSRTQAHPHMVWLLNKFLCYFLHYWKLHGLLFKHAVNSYMMTSSNGDIFHVTGPLCGNPTVTSDSPYKDQSQGALMFSLICTWTNGWANNWDANECKCKLKGYNKFLNRIRNSLRGRQLSGCWEIWGPLNTNM